MGYKIPIISYEIVYPAILERSFLQQHFFMI